MKKLIVLLTVISIIAGFQNYVLAQCEPDIINCIDTADPGQICPLDLPDGATWQPYEQVVTIIPPYEADLGIIGTVDIVKIVIDTIENLPPGLTYEANAEEFYADTAYCILLSGTPTSQGIFSLSIHVIPFIDVNGTPTAFPEQIDDTSLTITILSSGINEYENKDLTNFTVSPNPFNVSTLISFYSKIYGKAELNIIDYCGKLVFSEFIEYHQGNNAIEIEGEIIAEGIYFLLLKNDKYFLTEKLVKIN